MKTHKVIDLTDDCSGVFSGTHEECLDFISEQDSYGYEISILSRLEKAIENDCLELL